MCLTAGIFAFLSSPFYKEYFEKFYKSKGWLYRCFKRSPPSRRLIANQSQSPIANQLGIIVNQSPASTRLVADFHGQFPPTSRQSVPNWSAIDRRSIADWSAN